MHKVNDNSRAFAKCTTPIKALGQKLCQSNVQHLYQGVALPQTRSFLLFFGMCLYIEGVGNYTG